MKSSQKPRFSVEANEWHKWAMSFMNSKMRCISRLVSVLGIDYLEEIFGYHEILDMMWSLRYQKIFLAITKKPGGKYWQLPNNRNIKYVIRVPRNAKEAAQFDK